MPAGDPQVRFPFAHDAPVSGFARLVGAWPSRCWLEVGGETVVARYGPWVLRTDLDNVASVEVSGPYRWYRVAGPARGSMADGGLTFATTDRGGICLSFRDPVPGIEPTGRVRHPGLTVTVADPERVAAVIREAAGLAAGPAA